MAEQEKSFLHFLLQASTRQAKLLLADATPIQLRAIAEVCLNLLHGEVQPHLLKALKPHRHLLRELTNKSLSVVKRRGLASRRAKAVVEILHLAENMLP